LVAAAISPETAAWAGGWADGLVTLNQPLERLRAGGDAFPHGGGRGEAPGPPPRRAGGGAGKPLFLQVHLSWARDERTALAVAHDQWASNVFDPVLAMELALPEQFEAAARFVTPEDGRSAGRGSSDLG